MYSTFRSQCPDLSTESITMFVAGLVPSAISLGYVMVP